MNAAQELARKRAESLSPERRKEIAAQGGKAAWKGLDDNAKSAEMKRRRAVAKRRHIEAAPQSIKATAVPDPMPRQKVPSCRHARKARPCEAHGLVNCRILTCRDLQ